jgi:TonB family protein
MSLILVVEQESRYIERISDALGADGWKVQAVPGHDEALAAVASQSPDLILVSAQAPGAERVVSAFSRRAGGPGVLVLLAEGEEANGRFGAEDRLGKPFTAQELRLAVKRAAAVRREAAAPAAVAGGPKLTSRQIFGDVLAEVEEEVSGTHKTIAPAEAPAPPAGAPPPAAAPPPPRAAAAAGGDEMQRRLDETLSGVFKPAAPAASKPAAKPAEDVDDLISKTLTGLHLEKELSKSKAGVPPPPAKPPAKPEPVVAAPPVKPPEKPLEKPAPAVTAAPTAAPVAPPEKAAPEAPAAAAAEPPAAAPAPPAPPPAPAKAAAAVTPPAPPAPAAPPPRLERTGTGTGAGKPTPMQELEELTRTRRPGKPAKAAAATKPAADPAATLRVPVPAEAVQPGQKFGQYTLLERIAVGGMAELYKARMRGVEGFQKTVAIKRILPHLTDNAEFVEMFIDEGKLAAQLTHPNIAHIYDLGKIGTDYYIAMEFVEGKDLRSTLNLARKKGTPLPMGLALLIAARLASALDYAHRKRDFDGRELGLVHRDVSPQNILLTSEGDIKLVDFGIAKAVSKASQTQMGALKGKLQYMSPEQAWGRPVDGRSDIFSLGAVLFEMLTDERLFTGDSEISVLEAVREGKIRAPREVNPAVPPEVNAIVMRALRVEPEDRYATAGELQQRLEAALYSLRPTPGHSDLAAYLGRLLESEPGARAEGADAAPAAVEPRESSAPTAVKAAAAAAARAGAEVPAMAPALPAGARPLVEEGRRGRGLLIAAMVGVVAIGALLFVLFGRGRGPETPEPGAAQTEAAGNPAQRGPLPAARRPQAPGGAPAAAALTTGLNVDQLVDQEMAKREEELKRRTEEEKKRLEREVEAAKLAAAKQAEEEAARAQAQQVAPEPAAAAPEPEPARQEPEPEPARQEPEPARQEPAPAAAPPEPEAPRTRAGDLVQLGPGVTPPQLVSYSKPQYPAAAKRTGVQGVVVVSLLVDEEGRVQEARIHEGVKQAGGLNEAALAAARTARYRPATKDGVPVKVWTRLRIPFKL